MMCQFGQQQMQTISLLLPIKFLMVGHTLFTVHSPETTYMIEEFRQKPDEHIHSEKELIFAILFAVTKYFQRALSQLNSQRLVLDNHLSERIHNKDLQELSQVEKVWFICLAQLGLI